ncbi:hypothetical protein SCP_0105230 [Sparassis crispa]|uniref:NTF2 domain-containing protein n=1 Tax=Sparassis crispa TaxID=139825 RepID=A0A401G654_9APHY|nr:hypothetical protein SCP_0105230 [Sparassis crispa]GBE77643.1 hypothetical protein SCP_0105230 [Sparassis crispa]
MSDSTINPPSITQWAEEHLRAIFNAVSEDVYDNAFDAFISKHVHVTVNGRYLSREHYKRLLRFEKIFDLAAAPAELSFEGVVEAPADEDHPTNAGTVGLLYKAVVASKDTTSRAPTSDTVHSSLNVVIILDNLLVPPPIGYFDPRRVSHLSEVVVVDQENPVIMPSLLSSSITTPAVSAHA